MDIFFSLQNLSALKNADLRWPLICLAFNLRPNLWWALFLTIVINFSVPSGMILLHLINHIFVSPFLQHHPFLGRKMVLVTQASSNFDKCKILFFFHKTFEECPRFPFHCPVPWKIWIIRNPLESLGCHTRIYVHTSTADQDNFVLMIFSQFHIFTPKREKTSCIAFWLSGVCDMCGETPPSLQWMYPQVIVCHCNCLSLFLLSLSLLLPLPLSP